MVGDFFVWAHRGASAEAPENTLAAFRAAETAGADGIELDLRLSRDGIPMVVHDETVERVTDGRGAVAAMTRAELQALDAGGWFAPVYAGERMPTLAEVLEWAGDRVLLNLEMKTAAVADAVLALLLSFPRARVLFSSFDHRQLIDLRRRDPSLQVAFLIDTPFWRQALARAAACGAVGIHPRADRVGRLLVRACRRKGLVVYPWTVDDGAHLKPLLRLGVDGVFTNDPRRIVGCLEPDRFARGPADAD